MRPTPRSLPRPRPRALLLLLCLALALALPPAGGLPLPLPGALLHRLLAPPAPADALPTQLRQASEPLAPGASPLPAVTAVATAAPGAAAAAAAAVNGGATAAVMVVGPEESETPEASEGPDFSAEPTESEEPSPDMEDQDTALADGAADAGPATNPPAGAGADGDPLCFPGDALVTVRGRGPTPLREVRTGAMVWTGAGWSAIFMWTHRVPRGDFTFVRLGLGGGGAAGAGAVTLTAGHYLYVGGALRAAGSVRVGERVQLGDGRAARVRSVRAVRARGLYNPQTLHGDIVVDGVRASTYTTAVAPRLARALLAPLRAAYRCTRRDLSAGVLEGGAKHIARWLPKGPLRAEL